MDVSRQAGAARYSVREAAALCGLAERTLWRRIWSGKLPAVREVDDTSAGGSGVVRVWIAAADVPAPAHGGGVKGASAGGDLRGLVAQIRADVVTLRSDVAALRREVAILSAAVRARGEAGAGVRPSVAIPTPTPPESAYSAAGGGGGPFPSRQHAARWLCAGHGPPAPNTVKSWREWTAAALGTHPTPAQVWRAAALAYQRVGGNWRSSWTLRECGEPACPCHALAGATSA